MPVFTEDDMRYWNPRYASGTGVSRLTRWQLSKFFCISNLPNVTQVPEAMIGHVFMTRPNLNLTDDNLDKMKQLPIFSGIMAGSNRWTLLKTLGHNADSRWLPLVFNKARSYNVDDIDIKSVEKGETYFGQNIHYATASTDYKKGGTISIEFNNDPEMTILTLMTFWWAYMDSISKDDYLQPRFKDIWYGELDYDASIFYVVTTLGSKIMYWDELIGVHPKRIPLSNFSWNNNAIVNETVSIEFEYSIRREPYDTSIFHDINLLTTGKVGDSSKVKIIRPVPSPDIGLYDLIAEGPVIKRVDNTNNDVEYFLEFTGSNIGDVKSDGQYLTLT